MNQLYLYDPRYNLKTPITAKELSEKGILGGSNIYTYKSKRKKINKINKYIIDDSFKSTDLKKLYCKEVYDDERWATVTEYDCEYKISNYGRIKRIYKTKEVFLLPCMKKKIGYLYVKFKKNNKFIPVKVYKLVAKYFLDNTNNEKYVVHINGIKHDDRACNLEYISKQQLGKIYGCDACSVPVYKIDNMNFEIIDTFRSGREAAKIDNICYQSIFDVINKKSRLTIDEFAYTSEDEYENFIDTIDEKKYILFNSITYKKDIGTIRELNDMYPIGIYSLKYIYDTKKSINNNNIYLLDSDCNESIFNRLHQESTTLRELWRTIDIKGFEKYMISDYGRVKNNNEEILIPKIIDNSKYIELKDTNNNIKTFEICKLVCLFFKKTMFKNKSASYEDLNNYKAFYADNNYYNTKSTNIELFDKNILDFLKDKEKNIKVASVTKKKKIIKKIYENIHELSKEIDVDLQFLYLCIKDSRRIKNKFYMFENDCKNFNYE